MNLIKLYPKGYFDDIIEIDYTLSGIIYCSGIERFPMLIQLDLNTLMDIR